MYLLRKEMTKEMTKAKVKVWRVSRMEHQQ